MTDIGSADSVHTWESLAHIELDQMIFVVSKF